MGGYRAGRIEYHSSQPLSRDKTTIFNLVYVFVVYQLNVVNQVLKYLLMHAFPTNSIANATIRHVDDHITACLY